MKIEQQRLNGKPLPSCASSIKHVWICDDLGSPCARWLIQSETVAVKCWERNDLCQGYFWSLIHPASKEIKEVITISGLWQEAVSNNGITLLQWASLLTKSTKFPFLFPLCSCAGDPADFYLHLFQLQQLFNSQLSFPEILLKLGAMEISDSLRKEPAHCSNDVWCTSLAPLSETATQECSGYPWRKPIPCL